MTYYACAIIPRSVIIVTVHGFQIAVGAALDLAVDHGCCAWMDEAARIAELKTTAIERLQIALDS